MGNLSKIDSSKQIKLGAVISYITIAINMISGLIYTPWIIDSIGASDYGLYTLAGSFIAIFMMDFGLSAAVSRFIAKYLAEKDRESIDNFLGIVYKLYFLIDIIIMLVLIIFFFFLGVIYKELTAVEITKFKVLYIIVGLSNLISFPFITLNGILTAYEKFIQLKLCNILQKIFIIVCTIIALLCGKGVYSLVLINLIANIFIIVIKLFIINRKTTIKINFSHNNKSLMKELFSFSAWNTIISIAQRLVYNIMPSLLAVVSGTVSITLFGLASTLEGYIFSISDAINGLFLPKVSRIVAGEDKKEQIIQLMIKVGRINFMVISLFIIGFICAGKEFITLWMGTDYISAYYTAILLIFPCMLSSPQQIARTQLIAENKIKYQALIDLFVNLINVVIALVICKKYGAVGAGIAIFLTSIIKTILMNFIYKKIISIDIIRFFKECMLRLAPAMVVFFIAGMAIFEYLPSAGWIFFMFKVCLLALVYAIILYFCGLNNYEKDLVWGSFKRTIKRI